MPDSILINDVVLAETFRTLARGYRYDRAAQAMALHHLLATYTFRFQDRDVLLRALRLFEASAADLADCLILSHNEAAGCDCTASFDQAMGELPRG